MKPSFEGQRVLVWAGLLIVCAISSPAQSGTANGSIRGVKDASGAPVAHAAVEARNVLTGYERKSVSDGLGVFELPLLSVGSYKVQVKASGLSSRRIA